MPCWQYPEGPAVHPRFAVDAVAEAREGKATDDKVVTQCGGSEPWRGEAQEGNDLERGLTNRSRRTSSLQGAKP
jgi:hypothetical protein